MSFEDPFKALDNIKIETSSQAEPKQTSETRAKPEKRLTVTKTKPKEYKKITGDKEFDKNQIIAWFIEFLKQNKDNFTLDWLRGQKLSFQCVNEVRKK